MALWHSALETRSHPGTLALYHWTLWHSATLTLRRSRISKYDIIIVVLCRQHIIIHITIIIIIIIIGLVLSYDSDFITYCYWHRMLAVYYSSYKVL